ncbi:hypothetical protein [Luteipulveratus mongoliensis]|uniref:Diadenosine tetraphosphate hydrolase n=1 Tax=Luteipulveratus mongoliensis TaxID=571913 RepID=A0A0K1JN16_9MICO|nr:hypothetical protein [Luteipulveratus mongoliensis]AKU18112.1 hypothetical protein VV02_23345 [Luteipulveratus mongoliensis]
MSLPYAEPLTVREPCELVVPEPPRRGEPGGDVCGACEWSDRAQTLWSDEQWRLHSPGQTSLRGAVWLASTVHVDSFADLPPEHQASFGPVCARVDRALMSLDGVARVYLYRWGDGGAHFHVWFMPRPIGRLDMMGHMLPVWEDTMPPLSRAEIDAVGAEISSTMAI